MTTHAKFFQKHTQNDSLYHNSTYNILYHDFPFQHNQSISQSLFFIEFNYTITYQHIKHDSNTTQTQPSSLNPLPLSLVPKHTFYAKPHILIQYFSNQT
jgi:hypothetical protein